MKKSLLAVSVFSLVLLSCAASAGASLPTLASLATANTARLQARASLADPLAALALRQATLTAGDGGAVDFFGYSVAFDGDTALVGAYGRTVGTNVYQGAAYVFVRSGSTWSQQGDALTAADGAAGDYFGSSVALAGDTALIGSPYHQVGDKALQGAAYVFVRSGDTWSHQGGALIASGGAANDWFGSSVALDGDTALIGAPYHKVGSNADQGAAYIFVRSANSWSQQGHALTASGSRDGFGYSVALSGDRALVGSPRDIVGTNIQGSAYVFVRYGSTWSQQGGALATASDGVHDFFGSAVALSGDTALVGAPYHKVGSNAHQGATYVYQLPSITRPTLGTPTCPGTLRRDSRFTVSGSLAPHFADGSRTVTVKAYRYVGQEWRLYKSYSAVNADAGSASKYKTARLELTLAGKYRFRAFTTATMQWAAARSGFSETLTVK